MTTALLMMEAALFQLRAALPDLQDDFTATQLRLAADVLANAIAGARDGVNPARVSDIEFALADLAGIAEMAASDAISAPIAMLQDDVQSLRAAAALDPALVAQIRTLQAKLRERKTAMERNQYRVEGTPEAALPHEPESLRAAAIPLARQLAAAGFDTPALDVLVADPDSIRYHHLSEISDELETIAPA
ncbi:MAG TPA: hypothetical protein VFN10_00295 [Thermoanaerobaculia bacterium]|nr:hypothetical protein [Thermoanaerobaculia bacterium]